MAASLIAPPAAWTTRVAGANYQGLTLALPIDGIGGIISPAEQRPPPYAPLTTPPDYLTIFHEIADIRQSGRSQTGGFLFRFGFLYGYFL